jgi:hypothetical protein
MPEPRVLQGEIVVDETDNTVNVVSVESGEALSSILWAMEAVGECHVKVTVEVLED